MTPPGSDGAGHLVPAVTPADVNAPLSVPPGVHAGSPILPASTPAVITDATPTKSKSPLSIPELITRVSFISPLIAIPDWRLHEAGARRVIGACATIGSVTGHRRVKRKALTLLTTVVDNGHLAPLCQPVVRTILDISTHPDNTTIQGACDHAIQSVARSHPIVGMTAIQWAAASLIRSEARQRAPLISLMKKWQKAASQYLGRAPISVSRWHKIITALTTDDSTKTSWGRRWDPPDGRVQWDAQGLPAPEFAREVANDTATHETHMAWNANDLRSRWQAGDLVRLLLAHTPDTLAISEIKTSLLDFDDPKGLRHVLANLGYPHCAFNWCTTARPDGTKGTGNFGIAVLSRHPLRNVHFGIGHDALDKEGRCITGTVCGKTFVWPYAPCSRFDDAAERSKLRVAWDTTFHAYCTRLRERYGHAPFVFGDINLAPTDYDCTRNVTRNDPAFPSTKPAERAAYRELLATHDMTDAYLELNHDLREAYEAGEHRIRHFSWSNNGKAMRVDHMLAPRSALDGTHPGGRLVECTFTSKFNSDHRGLLVKFLRDPPPTTTDSDPSPDVASDSAAHDTAARPAATGSVSDASTRLCPRKLARNRRGPSRPTTTSSPQFSKNWHASRTPIVTITSWMSPRSWPHERSAPGLHRSVFTRPIPASPAYGTASRISCIRPR